MKLQQKGQILRGINDKIKQPKTKQQQKADITTGHTHANTQTTLQAIKEGLESFRQRIFVDVCNCSIKTKICLWPGYCWTIQGCNLSVRPTTK